MSSAIHQQNGTAPAAATQIAVPGATVASPALEAQKFPAQNAATNLDTSSSGTGSGSEGKRVSTSDIQFVQNLIERCLQLYMTQAEISQTLQTQVKIEPGFTNLVWQKLEEQNPDFFRAYYMRLKVKDQIVLFNHLVEQQAQVLQKLQRTLMQQLPPTLFPRPGMPMPMPPMPMHGQQPMQGMPVPTSMLMNGGMLGHPHVHMPFPTPSQPMMMPGQHMAMSMAFMPPPQAHQASMQQAQQMAQQQQQQQQQQNDLSHTTHDGLSSPDLLEQQNPLDILAASECPSSDDMGLLPMPGSTADLMSGVLAFGNGCQPTSSNEVGGLQDLHDHAASRMSGLPKIFSFSDINGLDLPGQMMGDGERGMGLQGHDFPRSFSLSDMNALDFNNLDK